MAEKGITRLPVVERGTQKLLGLLSLDDLLKARSRHFEEERHREQTLRFPFSGGTASRPDRTIASAESDRSESRLQKA